jgi:hypothetical protein
MNDAELIQEVRDLARGNSFLDKAVKQANLREEAFLEFPGMSDLLIAFHKSSFFKSGEWNWHQFVDMALEDPEKFENMHQRTISLLSDFGNSYEEYFVLKTDSGLYHVPNLLSDLNKLKILYREYFEIYTNILNRLNFDNPNKEQIGRINGKINWTKTIRKSHTKFPMIFVTSLSKSDFKTPENILLLVCAHWMNNETKKLLEINFIDEPLSKLSREILYDIFIKSKFILDEFPFRSILDASKKYFNLMYNPPSLEIKNLESDVKLRIDEGEIRNEHYEKLLAWIEKFRNLNIKLVDSRTPTRSILDSIENYDTIYEIWIFMEFVNYLNNKGVLKSFTLKESPKCEFYHGDDVITFWFNKEFSIHGDVVWAKNHKPDFIAMIDDNVIGVFDAKNYGPNQPRGDTQNTILAYMNNFNTSFGALIYPNYPEYWDMMSPKKRNDMLGQIVAKKYHNENNTKRRKIREKLVILDFNQLTEEYRDVLPNGNEIKKQARTANQNNFHNGQTMASLRMPYLNIKKSTTEEIKSSIKIKNETLEYLYHTIIKSIPLKTKSDSK